jgi:hypothetical protein
VIGAGESAQAHLLQLTAKDQPASNDRPVGDDGEREILLAKVLVGSASAFDITLVIPPFCNQRGEGLTAHRFHMRGSPVHVMCENGRAYSLYLTRCYEGRRDPLRTPYASCFLEAAATNEAAGAGAGAADTSRLPGRRTG